MKKNLRTFVCVTVAATLAVAACSQAPDTQNQDAKATDDTASKPVSWRLTSIYPSSLLVVGTMGTRLVTVIDEITEGSVKLDFHEPGALTPPLETFDAVSVGAIEAGWSSSGFWAGKIPALQLFSAVPFGPRAAEYLSWFDYGGGREIFENLYHQHNVHGLICGVSPPEASGWFKKEIKTVDDLKGLKIRFFGLGGKVLEKLGAAPQLIVGGEIYQALELGTIDATEYSMPAVDERMGFYEVASHYYFPGWHQQATFFELIFNLEKWQSLSKTQQVQIEAACSNNIRYGLSEGEALQAAAIQSLKNKGVNLHSWSPEILDALEAAWHEVADDLSAQDEEFAKTWTSLKTFRKNYAVWEQLGYVGSRKPDSN